MSSPTRRSNPRLYGGDSPFAVDASPTAAAGLPSARDAAADRRRAAASLAAAAAVGAAGSSSSSGGSSSGSSTSSAAAASLAAPIASLGGGEVAVADGIGPPPPPLPLPPTFPPAAECFRLVRYRDPYNLGSAERRQLIAMYRTAFAEELEHMASQGRATTASLGVDEAYSWVFGGKTLFVARCVGVSGDPVDEIAAFATCEQTYPYNPMWVRGIVTSPSFRRRGIGALLLRYIVTLPASEFVLEYWTSRPEWLERFYTRFGFVYSGYKSSSGPEYRQLRAPKHHT
jgi:GNAT superfamily N-acetyltransferase